MNFIKKMLFWLYAFAYESVVRTIPHLKMMGEISSYLHGNVLDIGCGTAPLIPFLPKEVTGYVGVDPEEGMLKRARKKSCSCTTRFVNGTIQSLSGSDLFDVIVTSNSLYTWDDPRHDMQRVSQLLREGGKMILVNPKDPSGQSKVLKAHIQTLSEKKGTLKAWMWIICRIPALIFILSINKMLTLMGKAKSLYFPSQPELLNLLKESGFVTKMCMVTYAEQAWFVVAEREGDSENENKDRIGHYHE